MEIVTRGTVVVVMPESTDDSIIIESNIYKVVSAGYTVERKKWGGLIVSDPSLKFKWESAQIKLDISRMLAC